MGGERGTFGEKKMGADFWNLKGVTFGEKKCG